MTSNSRVRILTPRRATPIDGAPAPAAGTVTPCQTVCATCNLRELCVPCCGLTRSEMGLADRLAFRRLRLRRGEYLYRADDPLTCLYAVRNGFFKCSAMLENGRDQVTGFSMTGEVLGMDGIGPERHTCSAVALEDSEVCAIPFAGLQELAHEIPSLQRQFHKSMSREIVRRHGVMLLLGSMNADERLAMFLLNLSQRLAARGYSASEFNLRMTREEIGSYLNLQLETVSRTFSKFQQEGLLRVHQKSVCILSRTGLEQVMGRGQE